MAGFINRWIVHRSFFFLDVPGLEQGVMKRKCLSRRMKRASSDYLVRTTVSDEEGETTPAGYRPVAGASGSAQCRRPSLFFSSNASLLNALNPPSKMFPNADIQAAAAIAAAAAAAAAAGSSRQTVPPPCLSSSSSTATNWNENLSGSGVPFGPLLADGSLVVEQGDFSQSGGTASDVFSVQNYDRPSIDNAGADNSVGDTSWTSSSNPASSFQESFENSQSAWFSGDNAAAAAAAAVASAVASAAVAAAAAAQQHQLASWKNMADVKFSAQEQLECPTPATSTAAAAAVTSQPSVANYFDDIFNSLCRQDFSEMAANQPSFDAVLEAQLPPFASATAGNSSNSSMDMSSASSCSSGPSSAGSCSSGADSSSGSTNSEVAPPVSFSPASRLRSPLQWAEDPFHYSLQAPLLRVLRPGNAVPITVHSNCNQPPVTCVTYCNTLPRTSSRN